MKGPYDRQGRRKYLNQAENLRFLVQAERQDLRETCLSLTLYYTGCRISEALALTSSEIDWEEGEIIFSTLKRRKAVKRRVPIPPILITYLGQLAQVNDDCWLFPYSRSSAWRCVKMVMEKAEVIGAQACPKGLRHAFGVRAAMAKVPIHLIQDWMGHSDPKTTSIYLAVQDEEERELIKRTWIR